MDTMRIRAFPFADEVRDFIDGHDTVILVEQNRDAQMKTLLVNELGIDPERIDSILYYGGVAISADYICSEIMSLFEHNNLFLLREVAS